MKKLVSLLAKLCVFLLISGFSFLVIALIFGSIKSPDPESVLATVQVLFAFIAPILLGALVTWKIFKPEGMDSENDIQNSNAEIDYLLEKEESTMVILKEELSCWNWQLVVGGLIFGAGLFRIVPNFFLGIVLIVLGLGILSIGGTKYKEKKEMQERELRRKIYAAVAKEREDIMQCRHCGNEMPKTANFCDRCGEAVLQEVHKSKPLKDHKKAFYQRWWFWAIAVVLLLVSFCNSEPTEETTPVVAEPAAITDERTDPKILTTESPVAIDAATVGEKNALRKAYSYLDFTAFSYTGLIDQLKYEGFTSKEAAYAAENCGADWFYQAQKKAVSYLDYTAFSYTGLIDQLKYEGFTADQAAYAADNCGADWNEQAARKAASYLEFSGFSRQGDRKSTRLNSSHVT